MKGKVRKLTEKEIIFIAEYCINGFNATKAAIKAGFSKRSARQIATRLLSKDYIREAIKNYLDGIIGQYKDTLEYEIIQHYKLLAFYNPDDIIDQEGKLRKKTLTAYGDLAKCIKGIQVTYNARGKKQTKVLLYDRDSALEKLAQYMKLLTQNIALNVKDDKFKDIDYSKLSEDEARELRLQMMNEMNNKKMKK